MSTINIFYVVIKIETKDGPPLRRIARGLEDRSARGIAQRVGELIVSGAIPAGTRLPTTRALAAELGVSAGLISDAWKLLVTDGMLETGGRRGTVVIDRAATNPWRQFRRVVGADLPTDLSTGFPDPGQLIDLRPYLRRLARCPSYPGYPTSELDPHLADALATLLPFPPTDDNTLLATHILGAMAEILPVLGGPGTRVVVAEPEFAPYLDLLERFRLDPVPLPMDDEGLDLGAFRDAVAAGAKAVILQPRVHNPSGVVTSRTRLRAIARLCASHNVWILDGDFYGELLPVPCMTAAEWAPEHTLYMKAFSKDIHPDIRVAVINSAPRLIREVHRRRVGGFDISRVNQDLLRLMLEDEKRIQHTRRTRDEYRRRQSVFVETLAQHGIDIPAGGGFNVWVPVRSERDALVYLASKGIGVAPGSAFQVNDRSPHIRVSTAAITGDVRAVARQIAVAASVVRAKG